jgi:DNA primase
MISEDYKDFINSKVWEYLPSNKVKTGDDINFRCPFCGDSSKSALKKRGHYSISKAIYHCFNCDISMSGLKLLEHLSGQNFEDIKLEYTKLRLKSGNLKSTFNQLSASNNAHSTSLSVFSTLKPIINKEWKQKLSSDALQYLDNRLITRSPFYKDTFYSVYDKNNNEYILIPWKVNSIECYYQLNDFKKIDKFNRKYIFPSKIEKPVFGLDNIDLTWNKIIICEGVYDSLFVKNGICCGGKTLTDYQLKLIKERYPRHEIIISLDNDEAGLKSVANIIKKTPVKFKFFKWFNNNTIEKDINDYVLKTNDVNIFSNKDKLDKMIVSSVEMKLFLISKGLW